MLSIIWYNYISFSSFRIKDTSVYKTDRKREIWSDIQICSKDWSNFQENANDKSALYLHITISSIFTDVDKNNNFNSFFKLKLYIHFKLHFLFEKTYKYDNEILDYKIGKFI